ncbi:MAG: NAD(P)/FAD-dependent oxidoreductase [Akkermansiaceae bacterium]|nr:NAD(P)/FAD-dependent oxidoreductase [Armatimonadota bacterium]
MHSSTVIIGAGPAGLTAAYSLVKNGVAPLVLEMSDKVGGISRTEVYKNYRFDIGGHRFFTKVPEVESLWREVLGEEFLRVPRLSRIYYGRKFYDYPLRIATTVRNLGPLESTLILASYAKAQLRWKMSPHAKEETFEQWVIHRFGSRLYRTFFKTYTEKVWGIPCTQIRSDWAAQRIQGMSLVTAIRNALKMQGGDAKSLIKEFDYPRLGPGMMWERFAEKVEEAGGEVRMQTESVRVLREANRITGVVTRDTNGAEHTVPVTQLISSMAVTELIARIEPPPPEAVLIASANLKHRDFLVVALILRGERLFPDNWIYIHSPDVKVGRIQNFANWSPAMVPDPDRSCLGMEYFCQKGDGLWQMPDAELIALAKKEVGELQIANPDDVVDGAVVRQPLAYPVYDGDYKENLDVVRGWLETLENFQTIGRNGLHRYNNQDHSMLTAILAVRNLFGEGHNLWEVNTERSYHEDFVAKPGGKSVPEGGKVVLSAGKTASGEVPDSATVWETKQPYAGATSGKGSR